MFVQSSSNDIYLQVVAPMKKAIITNNNEATFLDATDVQDILLNALYGLYLLRVKVTLHDIEIVQKAFNIMTLPNLHNLQELRHPEHTSQQTRVYNS